MVRGAACSLDFLTRFLVSSCFLSTAHPVSCIAMSQIIGQADAAASESDAALAPLHVDGLVVEGLVSGVRRPLESMHQMARLEVGRRGRERPIARKFAVFCCLNTIGGACALCCVGGLY